MHFLSRFRIALPVLALALACSDTATEPGAPSAGPSLNIVGEPGFVLLKKFGPASAFTFEATMPYGSFPAGNPFTVNVSEWTEIWRANDAGAPTADMEIFEVLPANMQITEVWILPLVRGPDGTLIETNNFPAVIRGTNQFTIPNLGWNNGAYVLVYNAEGRGAEGCTPGYWKQQHHFDSWVGYTPEQAFGSVFANAFPGKSLVGVLSQGGGGLKALGRHTVAALLNASTSSSGYGMTTAEVIAAFNAAYASGNYESLKSQLESMNERNCYLN